MPFKSKAQRRKFAELLVKGEITPETFEEWNRETGNADLPERAPRKSARKRAAKKKTASSARKKSPAKKSKSARKSARKRTTARKGGRKTTRARK